LFIGITHEAWKNWNTKLNRMSPKLTEKHTKKGRCMSSKRWWTLSKLFCKFFKTNKN
jgi:hypothetical protein